MDCFNFRTVYTPGGLDSSLTDYESSSNSSNSASRGSSPSANRIFDRKHLESQLFDDLTQSNPCSRKSSVSSTKSACSWLDFPQVLNLDDNSSLLYNDVTAVSKVDRNPMAHTPQYVPSTLPTTAFMGFSGNQSFSNTSIEQFNSRRNQFAQPIPVNAAPPQMSPSQMQQKIYPNQEHLNLNGRDFQDNISVFVVSFKNAQRDFILGVRVPAKVNTGDAVIVAVDRGEDLGIVSRVLSMQEYMMERFHTVHVPSNFNINRYVGCILRLATPRECRMLSMKTHDENEVLEYARHVARNIYNVPLHVVDAEYQFDRHKITIYFEAKSRVDYRDFVQDLYNTFKARVWMERVGF